MGYTTEGELGTLKQDVSFRPVLGPIFNIRCCTFLFMAQKKVTVHHPLPSNARNPSRYRVLRQVENGPTYTGQWSGSKREGHGTLFFDKGVFEGQWIQGNAHGKGIVHFKMLGWRKRFFVGPKEEPPIPPTFGMGSFYPPSFKKWGGIVDGGNVAKI